MSFWLVFQGNGGDIYELYASSNGCCMLETFVSQIMRQVVLALAHLWGFQDGARWRDVADVAVLEQKKS